LQELRGLPRLEGLVRLNLSGNHIDRLFSGGAAANDDDDEEEELVQHYQDRFASVRVLDLSGNRLAVSGFSDYILIHT
jgi:hypothetical protein